MRSSFLLLSFSFSVYQLKELKEKLCMEERKEKGVVRRWKWGEAAYPCVKLAKHKLTEIIKKIKMDQITEKLFEDK